MNKLTLGAVAVPVVLLAGVSGAAVASGPDAHQAATKTVTLKDIEFKPANSKIAKGDSLLFAFKDGTTVHNVRSKGRLKFKGSSNKSRGTFRVRFSKAGKYAFVCTLHPGMDGSVTVK